MNDFSNPKRLPAVSHSRRRTWAEITMIGGSLCLILLLSLLSVPPAHSAQTDSNARDNGGHLPNFGGIWVRQGSFLFDPAVRNPLDLKPPYKPDWMKAFDDYRKQVAETGVVKLDPTAGCLPPGMPRMMGVVYPMEILMTPGQVTIITEWMGQIRRVFTDGRPHPDDPDITYVGHSIGHWEKGVLVIDTVAMKDDTLLDQSGMKHSADIHVIERMRLLDPQTLENQLTLEDPIAFTHPWTVTRTFKRAKPGEEIREFVCMENNRNPIKPDGSVGVILQGNGK
jgi:hypothetical protein